MQIIIIIIIMDLRSVSTSKDVILDTSRPGIKNSELLESRREERSGERSEHNNFHQNAAACNLNEQ